jgi:hypothetical protein
MQIRIDTKSLVLGLILGLVVFLAMGEVLSGAGKTDFGFTIGYRGYALVTDKAGMAYVIDPQRARAETVEYGDGPYKGRNFDLNRAVKIGEK